MEKPEFRVDKENDTITRIQWNEREVILLGTAHVSAESVTEVDRLIEEENPDHVCVELDVDRFESMKKKNNWQDMNISQVLKQKKGFMVLANLALSSFQKKAGAGLGIKPGEEMIAAVVKSEEMGISYSFADRPIQTTLRRAWAKSNFWNKMKLSSSLVASIFTNESMEENDVESLKDRSALDSMMQELGEYLPSIKEVLIDERDLYLATKIFNVKKDKVLAVVGAGHVPGIIKILEQLEKKEIDNNLTQVSQIPTPGKLSKAVPWIIPAIIVCVVTAGFVFSGKEVGLEMLLVWFLANGIVAGIGAIISLAHPLTIICTILAAPFTSMNPTIGVGIVSGLLQYFFRKPRVKDLENIQEDILSLKGWYKNRVAHILLVFLLTSIGSSIGTFYAIPHISLLLNS